MILLKSNIRKWDEGNGQNTTYYEFRQKMYEFMKKENPVLTDKMWKYLMAQRDFVSNKELLRAIMSGAVTSEIADVWREEFSKVVNQDFAPIWEKAVQQAIAQVKEEAGGYFYPDLCDVESWTNKHSARFVTRVTGTQREALNHAIHYAATTGNYSPQELANVIKPCIGLTWRDFRASMNYYDGLKANGLTANAAKRKATAYALQKHKRRARVISTNELVNGFREGEYDSVKEAQRQGAFSQEMTKRWSTSGDARVCPICKTLDGQVKKMNEKFVLPSGIQIDGPEGAHICCRCVMIFEEPYDAV